MANLLENVDWQILPLTGMSAGTGTAHADLPYLTPGESTLPGSLECGTRADADDDDWEDEEDDYDDDEEDEDWDDEDEDDYDDDDDEDWDDDEDEDGDEEKDD